MRSSRTVTLILAISLVFAVCPRSYAPIYGTFPGLDELSARSEVIAVVVLLEQNSFEDRMGGYARYKVRVERALKGKPVADELNVRLRDLGIRTPTEKERRQVIEVASLRPFTRHVLFLERGAVGGDETAEYRNLNCEGSHFPVSPYADLKSLEGKSVMNALTFLLRDYCDFKRAELKHVEERTDIMLRGR